MPMLADLKDTTPQSGFFGPDLHRPSTFLYELIEFITEQLPIWRDRSDRKNETAETVLTSQLCGHLNSAARHSDGWNVLQFRSEEPDEQQKGRKIDLVPSPSGPAIQIEAHRYSDFESLLPIECKRLPTPKGKVSPKNKNDRDEREYVISLPTSTGGIQRFKAGHHGKKHTLGAMIAYVQKETLLIWEKRVAGWIKDLAESGQPGWTEQDLLCLETNDKELGLSVLSSRHQRDGNLGEIKLRHLWLKMK